MKYLICSLISDVVFFLSIDVFSPVVQWMVMAEYLAEYETEIRFLVCAPQQ